MANEKKAYDWKKTAKKVGIDVAVVVLSGLIALWQNNPYYFALVPVLKAILDIVKHY